MGIKEGIEGFKEIIRENKGKIFLVGGCFLACLVGRAFELNSAGQTAQMLIQLETIGINTEGIDIDFLKKLVHYAENAGLSAEEAREAINQATSTEVEIRAQGSSRQQAGAGFEAAISEMTNDR